MLRTALAIACALAIPAAAHAAKPHKPATKFVHPCTKNAPVEQLRCTGAHDGNDYAIELCGTEFFASSWKDGKSLERWPVQHSKHGTADVYKFATTGFELSVHGKQAAARIVKTSKPERLTCSKSSGQQAQSGAGASEGQAASASTGSAQSASPAPAAPEIPAKCGFCYGTAQKTRPEWDSNLSDQRRKILETAEGFLHKVSDCGGEKGEKAGADILVDLYKTAFGSLDAATEKQVRKANNKAWRNGPWSWCGIFAAAVVNKAGFSNIGWGIGKLKGLNYTGGHKGVKPGDIAFWVGGLNHHNIVEKIDGDTVYTLDGNQECSGIMRKKRKLKDIAGYYNIAQD
jgi:hypothetical protein